MASVWQTVMVERWSTGRDEMRGYLEQLRKNVSEMAKRDGRQTKSRYSSYLFHQTGRSSPLSHSGEFEELTEYRTGDDPRTISWRRSAKGDRLLVTKKREREIRPVTLLVDLEWLAEGYKEHGDYQRRDLEPGKSWMVHPHLQELMRNLFIADKEGITPTLIFAARGYPIRTYTPKQLKRYLSHTPIEEEEGRYREHHWTDHEFLAEMFHLTTSANKCVKVEEYFLGKDGFEPTGILSGQVPEIPPHTIVVAMIRKKNVEPSMRELSNLDGKKGRAVHLYRG
jgi:hypothetical protein